jgi:3-oxoacyl-[acyl-carrier-protein] synthase-1
MRNTYITDYHIISSLGFGSESNFKKLTKKVSGIKKHKRKNGDHFYSSFIDKEIVNSKFSKIGDPKKYTILERMMILSVYSLLGNSKFEITNETGLIISTTKGNIDVLSPNSEFYEDEQRAYLFDLGKQIQTFFNIANEAIVLSNACVSGVLAISVADRLVKSFEYDSVIVVSGDLVTEFILSGFSSFQAISEKPCIPFSKNRSGITIGEAVCSMLIRSDVPNSCDQIIQIIGSGSCNDANHISGPSRNGEGLYLSVKSAMTEAQISEKDIDYISAHGTATEFNDEMESIAFQRLKMLGVPLNSLKGYYGHTLGSSGLLESIIGIESLYHNTLICSLGYDEIGVSFPINVIRDTEKRDLKLFLKTASGFGGSNAAVLFKKVRLN